MAVKPKDAAVLTESEVEMVALLENKIDAFLNKRWYEGCPGINLSYKDLGLQPSEMTQRIFLEVQRRFVQAGWLVTRSSDHEGDYLDFEEKK